MHNAYTLIDPSLSVDFIPNLGDEAVLMVYLEGLTVGCSLFKCTESKSWVWRGRRWVCARAREGRGISLE